MRVNINEEMLEMTRVGDTVGKIENRRNFKLVRKALALGLCGTIFLNSCLPLLTDREKLKSAAKPHIDRFCSFIVPYLDEWRPYTNPKPVNPCLEKEATTPLHTQEELETMYARALAEKEEQRVESYEARLTEYCTYFYLNKEKVINLARTLTENYTIGFENFLGNLSFQVDNEDAAIMMFVYRLYRNRTGIDLASYGIANYEDLLVDLPRRTRVKDEPLKLSCGDTGTEYIGRICDLLGVDKTYAVAISMYEAGRFNSPLCRESNNFGGIGGLGSFRAYPTPEAGIIDLVVLLKGYESLGLWSLEALSSKYVNGNISSPPSPSWVSGVRWFHYEMSTHLEEYFHMPTEDLDPESRPFTMKPVDKQ